MRRSSGQLAPVWLVRVIAFVLLAVGLFLVYVAVTSYSSLGIWIALLVGLSGVTTVLFSSIALKTGRAEWIMLDIILPY